MIKIAPAIAICAALTGCAAWGELTGPTPAATQQLLTLMGYTRIEVGAASDCYSGIGVARKFIAQPPGANELVSGKVCELGAFAPMQIFIYP